MERILQALGFDSKPDYAEKIPENLKPEDFNIHETFHHGFPSQPTCLDYDPLQQLLAIGTEDGAILLLGKPGLERYFKHPTPAAVLKMQFITNKGELVTCCDDGCLYLWSIQDHIPKVLHKLEFTRENEKPTCISHSYKSEWLYVGSEGGNVYIIHISSFQISGFTVYWDQAVGASSRAKPGHVLAVLEHPMDQGKILIAYNGGHCVLYCMKQHDSQQSSSSSESKPPADHKKFSFNPGDNHILTSVCWVGSGRHIACSYSDGSIVLWNSKSEAKPEKVFFLHECDPSQFRPIYKMQVVQTDSDPLYACSGGFPEKGKDAPQTLTISQGKSSTMVSCSSTIIDFLCLPSSPHSSDCQKPFALVIIAKNEMIIHDLASPGYPRYPSYSLPYALDIHLPAVTFIYYYASCPEEFIAQLHSVKSKMMTTSTKPWPLNGGKWGQEVPHSTTDIIITGHTDGSVRLWHCNSVIFQPFFTIDTSRYFKMNYKESPTKSSNNSSIGSSKTTPTGGKTTPTGGKTTPVRPPPPSHPPPRSKISSERSPVMRVKGLPSVIEDGELDEVGEEVFVEDEDSKGTPSPATGQVHANGEENTDGDVDVTEKKGFFHDRRTRKKLKSKSSFKTSVSDDPSGTNDHEEKKHSMDKKHSSSHLTSKKSFHKMAKLVKLGRSLSNEKKKSKNEEVDGESNEGGGGGEGVEEGNQEEVIEEVEEGGSQESSSSTSRPSSVIGTSDSSEQRPRKKRPPPRPNAIVLKQQDSQSIPPQVTFTTSGNTDPHNFPNDHVAYAENEEAVSATPSSQNHHHLHEKRKTAKSRQESPRRDAPAHLKSRNSPHRLTTRSQFSRIFSQPDDDYFTVNYINMCVCGLWLCVGNNGGNVMAFDFTTTPKSSPAGCIEINFDYDSVKKHYTPSPAPQPEEESTLLTAASSSSPAPIATWVYDDKVNDSSTGYQLSQLCQCFYTVIASGSGEGSASASPSHLSPSGSPSHSDGKSTVKKPVFVNRILYSTDIGLLAIATRRGFALIDTRKNSCVYTLNSSTSILYLSDPSKFTNQIKRESRLNFAARPSIKRHGTSLRFSENNRSTSVPAMKSNSSRPTKLSMSSSPDEVDHGEKTFEVSVELDSCVSSIELVQLQMDKSSAPMLTLWVGLASGYVAAYGVNVLSEAAKRIELIPTRFITETKSPLVNIFFLNEWGDWQVVPYKPNQALTGSGGRHRNSSSSSPGDSTGPRHYAIMVDEHKIRSYSFPGFNKVNLMSLPVSDEDKVILRSDYFVCNDLPCLVTITSCQNLFIHSLPGLKQMIRVPFPALSDPLVTGTFRVSGNGQGLFMSSPSEIQRISIVKQDMLNFPYCLPSVYSKREDVSPSSYGKGFLGALFAGTPNTVNREDMFGEAAVRPIGDIAKVDGETARPYGSTRKRRERGHARGDYGGGGPSRDVHREVTGRGSSRSGTRRTPGGLSGQMNKNLTALDERKKKLGDIEERTAKVADHASSYASLAAQLAKKYERM